MFIEENAFKDVVSNFRAKFTVGERTVWVIEQLQ